jgi:hypothetical protein
MKLMKYKITNFSMKPFIILSVDLKFLFFEENIDYNTPD